MPRPEDIIPGFGLFNALREGDRSAVLDEVGMATAEIAFGMIVPGGKALSSLGKRTAHEFSSAISLVKDPRKREQLLEFSKEAVAAAERINKSANSRYGNPLSQLNQDANGVLNAAKGTIERFILEDRGQEGIEQFSRMMREFLVRGK